MTIWIILTGEDFPRLVTAYPGAVVQVNAPDAVEVEFVTASGRTVALRTFPAASLRPVREDDLLAVRPAVRGAA